MLKKLSHFLSLATAMLVAMTSSRQAWSTDAANSWQATANPAANSSVEAKGNQPKSAAGATSCTELAESGDVRRQLFGKSSECTGNWLDNTSIFAGADAYKSLGDSVLFGSSPSPLSLGDNFGGVTGFNTGFALGQSRIRGQIGASYGLYDLKGRAPGAPLTRDDSLEQQTFLTCGFGKQSDVCSGDRISYGLVYDQMFDHQWGWAANELYLSQIRGILGYALNEKNEVGFWGTVRSNTDSVSLGIPADSVTTNVRAMNQANSYWRHSWEIGGSSMFYAGAVDNADVGSWQLGMLNTMPINQATSLYSNFTYVAPGAATGLVGSAEEQWNMSVGLSYSFGKKAISRSVSGNRGMPLLPVANNGSFLVTN